MTTQKLSILFLHRRIIFLLCSILLDFSIVIIYIINIPSFNFNSILTSFYKTNYYYLLYNFVHCYNNLQIFRIIYPFFVSEFIFVLIYSIRMSLFIFRNVCVTVFLSTFFKWLQKFNLIFLADKYNI